MHDPSLSILLSSPLRHIHYGSDPSFRFRPRRVSTRVAHPFYYSLMVPLARARGCAVTAFEPPPSYLPPPYTCRDVCFSEVHRAPVVRRSQRGVISFISVHRGAAPYYDKFMHGLRCIQPTW